MNGESATNTTHTLLDGGDARIRNSKTLEYLPVWFQYVLGEFNISDYCVDSRDI